MGAPKLSPEAWAEIQRASESGLDDATLSVDYNVPRGAIRARRCREKWLTPRKLHELAAIEELKAKTSKLTAHATSVTSPLASTVTAAEIARLREETPMVIAKKVSELILAGLPNIAPPSDAAELNTFNNIFRKSVGLEQAGGVNILVGNGMNWSSSKGNEKARPIVVVEAGAVQAAE